MKIKELFKIYEERVKDLSNPNDVFNKAKMINCYRKLEFGFFPLGSGILTDKSDIEVAEISDCKLMVLGNDFGNREYIEKKCIDGKREKMSSPTISNLIGNKGLKLSKETTFFTNLFLGLRQGKMVGLKDLDSDDARSYVRFSIDFFEIQLKMINPKIVLCLGNEVRQHIKLVSDKFNDIATRKFKDLYNDKSTSDFIVKYDNKIFIFIPHPCFAHISWKNNIRERILKTIDDNL